MRDPLILVFQHHQRCNRTPAGKVDPNLKVVIHKDKDIKWQSYQKGGISSLPVNQRYFIKNATIYYSWKTKDIVEGLIFTCTFLLRISSESSDTSILT
jgi:hypothetical protein